MCAALFGLIAGVLDDGLLPRASLGGTARRRAAGPAGRRGDRGRCSGIRSAPRTTFATPGTRPIAPISSCAIARGALRSGAASWNATVTARSPSARLGGTSIANGGTVGEAVLRGHRQGDPIVNLSEDVENHEWMSL